MKTSRVLDGVEPPLALFLHHFSQCNDIDRVLHVGASQNWDDCRVVFGSKFDLRDILFDCFAALWSTVKNKLRVFNVAILANFHHSCPGTGYDSARTTASNGSGSVESTIPLECGEELVWTQLFVTEKTHRKTFRTKCILMRINGDWSNAGYSKINLTRHFESSFLYEYICEAT